MSTRPNKFPTDSIFKSIEDASKDFEQDKIGFSPTKEKSSFKGVQLNTTNWDVSPLDVEHVESSLFSNRQIFPDGSIKLDHSFLMNNIEHNWQDVETICCT